MKTFREFLAESQVNEAKFQNKVYSILDKKLFTLVDVDHKFRWDMGASGLNNGVYYQNYGWMDTEGRFGKESDGEYFFDVNVLFYNDSKQKDGESKIELIVEPSDWKFPKNRVVKYTDELQKDYGKAVEKEANVKIVRIEKQKHSEGVAKVAIYFK